MSSANGVAANGAHAPADALEVIAVLRDKPRNVAAFKGFGPLVAGIVLFVLMLWLAPSVAPEHIVDKPVNSTTSTIVTATTTTAPTASTETTVAK